MRQDRHRSIDDGTVWNAVVCAGFVGFALIVAGVVLLPPTDSTRAIIAGTAIIVATAALSWAQRHGSPRRTPPWSAASDRVRGALSLTSSTPPTTAS